MAIVISLLLSGISAAEIYYVDSADGSDGNSGKSQDQAWRTIGKLIRSWDQIDIGDDILLKRGCVFTDASLDIRKSGTDQNPLVVGAYGVGSRPIIDCGSSNLRGGIWINLNNLHDIIIRDIHIKNAYISSGITVGAAGLQDITIQRTQIENCDHNGIVITQVDRYKIENCMISDCKNSGIAIIGTAEFPITNGVISNNVIHDILENDGITLHKNGEGDHAGPNHQILNNVCFRCNEQGLDLTSGSHLFVQGNETYDNGDSSILIGSSRSLWIDQHFSHDERKMGFIIGKADDIKVTNSIIYNPPNQALMIDSMTTCENIRFYNNIFIYGPASTKSLIDISFGAEKIIFRNNIISSAVFSEPSRFIRYLGGATVSNTSSDFSNNLWWRADGGASDNRMWFDGVELCTFQQWKNLHGFGEGSLFADPQFVNLENRDFHLRFNSPCIDAACYIGLLYDHEGGLAPVGFPPDIGAFQFGPLSYVGNFPVAGDWDGDGTTNYGIYRDGKFFLDSNWDGFADIIKPFGIRGDFPVCGDWDGDGECNIGVFRKGKFYLDFDNDGIADSARNFGRRGDIPVSGDWDGNGITDIGVFRSGVFYLDSSGDGIADIVRAYGLPGDIPVCGDWNGDGKTNYGVFRACHFLLDTDWNTTANIKETYGWIGDIPVIGDWEGVGQDFYGIYRSSLCRFFIDVNRDGIGDIVKTFGSH